MPHDCLGNSLSAAEQPTLRAVDDFIEGYLAYETRAENIIRAADADPACCIANVYAGLLRMLLETPAAAQFAARYLSAAETSRGARDGARKAQRSDAARLGGR